MLEFGLSVGIGKDEKQDSNQVLLSMVNMGSSTMTPDYARMLAAQLMIAADFLDPSELNTHNDD
jgi:hypothetical protein